MLVTAGTRSSRQSAGAAFLATCLLALVAPFERLQPLIALPATLEAAGVPAVRSGLSAFREGLYVVGGHTRASGTLQYPTVASMYFEIAFALTLGLFLAAIDRRSAATVAVLFCALILIAE